MQLLPDVVAYAVVEQVLGAVAADAPWLWQVWAESVDVGSENAHPQTQVGIHNGHDPWRQVAVDDS